MLNNENATELEKRVHERLNLDGQPDKLSEMIMKIATRATIITLQEYERMNTPDKDQAQ
jgi:hypothetical protein